MPARKADIKIIIEAYGKRFSLNCEEHLFGQYRIKSGRSVSDKKPLGTLTDIFELGRKWSVKQRKYHANSAL